MHLELEELHQAQELSSVEGDWRGLWEADPSATPFHSPDWLIPWTRRLWGGGQLRVMAIRGGGQLVGIAPFFLWGFGGKPEIIRTSFLGSGISDYLGMIAVPKLAGEAARLVIARLAAMRDTWHVCDFQELQPRAPLLHAEIPAGLEAVEAPCSVCPVLALPGSYDQLLASVNAKFRRNLRGAEKMLRSQGRAQFIEATPSSAPGIMRDLFRLHGARWQERSEAGMFPTGALQAFHLDVAERFAARGMLRLHALQLDGKTIAVQYNFSGHGRTYCYLSGFDPAWRKCSPGALTVAHSLRHAIESGDIEADFLRKREAFKYEWGARDRVNRKLLLTHSAAVIREVA